MFVQNHHTAYKQHRKKLSKKINLEKKLKKKKITNNLKLNRNLVQL